MKTIVIGDTHGCYNELVTMIEMLKEDGEYNKDTDKLVFLGDYIDRGENSRKVIEYVRSLQKDNDNVIALMGNHEDMLLNYLDGIDTNWIYNGCEATMDSYVGYADQFEDDINWMRNLPLYHEDDNFIYVHAGVDINKPMEEQDRFTLLWVRAPFINNAHKYHKTVIFGHTPMIGEKDAKPEYTAGNNIGIDTGCVFGYNLTALIIDDNGVDGYYQVEYDYNNSRVKA